MCLDGLLFKKRLEVVEPLLYDFIVLLGLGYLRLFDDVGTSLDHSAVYRLADTLSGEHRKCICRGTLRLLFHTDGHFNNRFFQK